MKLSFDIDLGTAINSWSFFVFFVTYFTIWAIAWNENDDARRKLNLTT